jgi:hypothetical protein
MLVYISCLDESGKEYSVAINPNHVVAVVEVRKTDYINHNVSILTSTGLEYRTYTNYLELVAKLNINV